MVFDSFFNAIFGSVITRSPLGGLILVSFIYALLTTIASKYLTNQELLKKLEHEMKELQKQIKNQKNPKRKIEIQKKFRGKKINHLIYSYKSTFYITLPIFIILLIWLDNTYKNLPLNLIGINSWLLIYVIFLAVFVLILRKLLKAHGMVN